MEDDSVARFTASDAMRMNEDRIRREFHGYARFAIACKARLRRFITEHPSQTYLVYAVPAVVVGSALRDARGVINHIIHVLHADGFRANYLGSNLIFISWDAAPIPPQLKVSDHVSAALNIGPSPAAPTRSSSRVRFDAHHDNAMPGVPVDGPGPPMILSDTDTYRRRLDAAISNRMSEYERDSRHPNARRRREFNNAFTHTDALRAAVARTRL